MERSISLLLACGQFILTLVVRRGLSTMLFLVAVATPQGLMNSCLGQLPSITFGFVSLRLPTLGLFQRHLRAGVRYVPFWAPFCFKSGRSACVVSQEAWRLSIRTNAAMLLSEALLVCTRSSRDKTNLQKNVVARAAPSKLRSRNSESEVDLSTIATLKGGVPCNLHMFCKLILSRVVRVQRWLRSAYSTVYFALSLSTTTPSRLRTKKRTGVAHTSTAMLSRAFLCPNASRGNYFSWLNRYPVPAPVAISASVDSQAIRTRDS